MADLYIFTTPELGCTWIGARDTTAGLWEEVSKKDPPSQFISPWAIFPKQGHLLGGLLNAFENERMGNGWHLASPEVVTLSLAGLVQKSLAGYRALQAPYQPLVTYEWP